MEPLDYVNVIHITGECAKDDSGVIVFIYAFKVQIFLFIFGYFVNELVCMGPKFYTCGKCYD